MRHKRHRAQAFLQEVAPTARELGANREEIPQNLCGRCVLCVRLMRNQRSPAFFTGGNGENGGEGFLTLRSRRTLRARRGYLPQSHRGTEGVNPSDAPRCARRISFLREESRVCIDRRFDLRALCDSVVKTVGNQSRKTFATFAYFA